MMNNGAPIAGRRNLSRKTPGSDMTFFPFDFVYI
jgi:hypothetical protein